MVVTHRPDIDPDTVISQTVPGSGEETPGSLTPLMHACRSGQTDKVRMLLEHGASDKHLLFVLLVVHDRGQSRPRPMSPE